MFEVRATWPSECDSEKRDRLLESAAGRVSDFGGRSFGPSPQTDRGWVVPSFSEARALRERLARVPGVSVTVRER